MAPTRSRSSTPSRGWPSTREPGNRGWRRSSADCQDRPSSQSRCAWSTRSIAPASVINTITGMAIDARARQPRLATIFGGLSGPAIKPVALRMVYQIHRAGLGIPVCGIGGIQNGTDAVEFLLAGAMDLVDHAQ